MSVPQSARVEIKTEVKESDKLFWTRRAIQKVLERVGVRRYTKSAADDKIFLFRGNLTNWYVKCWCMGQVPSSAYLLLSGRSY